MKVPATDDTSHVAKVTLDGNTGEISAGANGSDGALELFDSAGKKNIEITAGHPPGSRVRGGPVGNVVIDGTAASLRLKVEAQSGLITPIRPEALINSESIVLQTDDGRQSVRIESSKRSATLYDSKGNDCVMLDGARAYGAFGGGEHAGGLGLFPAGATNLHDGGKASIFLNGDAKVLTVGNIVVDGGSNGSVRLSDDNGKGRVLLDGALAYGAFGGSGHDGGLGIFPASATNPRDPGQASIFANGQSKVLTVGNITIDGNEGTISGGGGTIAVGSQVIERTMSRPLIKQNIPLFAMGHDGAFIVEFAAWYSQTDNRGVRFFGYSVRRWAVFTYKHTLSDGEQFSVGDLGGAGDSYPGSFWVGDGPSFSAGTNNNVQLHIPDLANPPNANDGTAALSVKTLLGTPPF